MKRVPRSREVEQAIVGAVREVKSAGKELSAEAARMLARGKYDLATAMVERCRLLAAFGVKLLAIRKEWRALRGIAVAHQERLEVTPMWKFYQPIAIALQRLNGQSRRVELEQELQTALKGQLAPGDMVATSKGIPRWKITVRRARRPMVAEGFIEYAKGMWSLTDGGRSLAQKPQALPEGELRSH